MYIILLLISFLFVSCNRYTFNCATYDGRKTSGIYTNKKSTTYDYKKLKNKNYEKSFRKN